MLGVTLFMTSCCWPFQVIAGKGWAKWCWGRRRGGLGGVAGCKEGGRDCLGVKSDGGKVATFFVGLTHRRLSWGVEHSS